MDIRMPELDGLQATRRILEADSGARILILTTFDLDEYVYEALRAGASGFVLKDDSPEQLIAAIRTVADGEALLSPTVTRRVIEKFARMPRPEPPTGLDDLSEREREVFRLMAAASRTGRLRTTSTSARRRSRRTSRTSSRSSASAIASRQSWSPTRLASSRRTHPRRSSCYGRAGVNGPSLSVPGCTIP
jgi:FixJ family two-component response regulator